jgi:hypothetical protein
MIQFLLLVSRQGKIRLSKWFVVAATTLQSKPCRLHYLGTSAVRILMW